MSESRVIKMVVDFEAAQRKDLTESWQVLTNLGFTKGEVLSEIIHSTLLLSEAGIDSCVDPEAVVSNTSILHQIDCMYQQTPDGLNYTSALALDAGIAVLFGIVETAVDVCRNVPVLDNAIIENVWVEDVQQDHALVSIGLEYETSEEANI